MLLALGGILPGLPTEIFWKEHGSWLLGLGYPGGEYLLIIPAIVVPLHEPFCLELRPSDWPE